MYFFVTDEGRETETFYKVLYIFQFLNQKLSIFGLFLTSIYHSPNQDCESSGSFWFASLLAQEALPDKIERRKRQFRFPVGNFPMELRAPFTSFAKVFFQFQAALDHIFGKEIWRLRLFLFRKQAMPFLTVDAKIRNQAFQNGRCYICSSLGLDKVKTD